MERVEDGCVVAALSSEMTRQNEVVRVEARHRVDAMIALVQAALPEYADENEASVITATMVGALQLARTLGGKEGLTILTHTRQALLERYQHTTQH